MSTTIHPDRAQALVKLGGCHVSGELPDMEVAAAAFSYAVTALTPTSVSEPVPAAATFCKTCSVVHYSSEPCATPGADERLAHAYARMEQTRMISRPLAGLFVDAALMYVERGEIVAATMVLNQFVLNDVAEEVVTALVRVVESPDYETTQEAAAQRRGRDVAVIQERRFREPPVRG
jgi:hypothetical protein